MDEITKGDNILMNASLQANLLQAIGAGTEDNPFIISDVDGFNSIRNNLSAFYKLAADLDFNGQTIIPIATSAVPFKGGLDGDGYVIKNFKITTTDSFTGLFRYATSAKLKNLIIENGEISQASTATGIGALAGYLNKCITENISLKNITIVGGQSAGALAGYIIEGSFTNCSAVSGTVSGKSQVGGLVGGITNSTAQYCYATMETKGTDKVGGLIGATTGSTHATIIKECYASANVTGSTFVGGLIGYAYATISDSFATGRVTSSTNNISTCGLACLASAKINNCYAACLINQGGRGLTYGGDAFTVATGSYYDSALAEVAGANTFNVGKLTAALIRKETYTGWNFDSVWDMTEGGMYPYLQRAGIPKQHSIDIGYVTAGIGTEADPYLIGSTEAFECIKYDMAGFYRLVSDIDFKGQTITPIGNLSARFLGGLDGDGHKIKNFKINTAASYTGLFAYAVSAKLRNLVIENTEIKQGSSYSYIGALVGYLENCTIENISLINVNISGGTNVGTLGGYANSGSYKGCSVRGNGSVSGTSYAGGLLGGIFGGTVQSCYAAAEVNAADYAGGLLGSAGGGSARVIECYAAGRVTGKTYLGGLIGYAYAKINDCFALGSVISSTNNSNTGGLIGYSKDTTTKNCYAVCQVSTNGGALGFTSFGTVTDSYYNSVLAKCAGTNGKLPVALIKKRTYTNWDFENVWDIEENTYPYLRSLGKPDGQDKVDPGYISVGTGTEEEPYLIDSIRALEYIRYELTAYYKITSDIECNGEAITPAGTLSAPFRGVLDGNGHTIKNFRIDTADSYAGLFGYATSAKLKNLILKSGENQKFVHSSYIGILAGYLNNCTITNIILEDVSLSGGYVGALAGYASGGSITDCSVKGNSTINGISRTGGLVGEMSDSTVWQCAAAVTAKGNENVGGLTGKISGGSIKECRAVGNVTGSANVGGLIGYQSQSDISDSFAAGSVISTSNHTYIGGLVGYAAYGRVKNCYAACQISNGGSGLMYAYINSVSVSSSYFDSVLAGSLAANTLTLGKLTTAMVRKQLYTNWDFENIWDIAEGNSYPYLRCLEKPDTQDIDSGYMPTGVGTEAAPYLIGSAEAFECIKYELTGSYRLVADIDFSSRTIMPMGSSTIPFTGSLDGNGHAIINFKISTTDSYTGLFRYAKKSKFINLSIENGEIKQTSTASYIGALTGFLDDCTTENIALKNISISGGGYTGALAGYVNSGSLIGCSVRGNSTVSGTSSVGGLAGILAGLTARHCYAAVETKGNERIGGLFGQVGGTNSQVKECYAAGKVTGNYYVGGLIGNLIGAVSDSFAVGSVTSTGAAGLVGYATSGSINNCYAACHVNTNSYGLVYIYGTAMTVKDSYFDNIEAEFALSNTNNIGKLTTALKRKRFYADWDFESVWDITEGCTYPYLRGVDRPESQELDDGYMADGIGTEEDPYLIGDARGFQYIKWEPASFYRLAADIVLNGEDITPIGTSSLPFTGSLDGDGHAIRNFKINSTESYTGLFRYAKSAKLRNLRMEKGEIRQTAGAYTGALAGFLDNCMTENICLIDIMVLGAQYTGALAGTTSGGSLTGCSVKGNSLVSGTTSVGGLTGSAGGCSVEECCAVANITGTTQVGGLIGYAKSTITDCFATGSVTSTTNNGNIGGLVGYGYFAGIKNCYAACSISTNGNGLAYLYSTSVTNSYFDSDLAGVKAPVTQARTTEQMLNKETYIDWDWGAVWNAEEASYPNLKNFEAVGQEPFELAFRELTYESVIIEWPDIPGAAEYEISYFNKIGSTVMPKALIEELVPDTDYVFQVRVKNGNERGEWSKALKIRTKKIGVINNSYCIGKTGNSITLTWEPVDDTEYYEVIYNGEIQQASTNVCTIIGLYPGIPYVIYVRALLPNGVKISKPIVQKIYALDPETDYAREFINKCEGQAWFMDEIENILNLKGKSINTIRSREDFETIYAIDLADRSISGKIPAAIGELYQLEYLYLANNNISGDLPDELYTLEKLMETDLSGNPFFNW